MEARVKGIDKFQGKPTRSAWSQKRLAIKKLRHAKKLDQKNREAFLQRLLESRSVTERSSV